MANFALVHGAWDGGWIFRKVARILRSAGHEVFAPTLTGLGERSHLRSMAISLDTHIQDVVNVIAWEDLDQVVLCGHANGGTVITGVADAIPEKLKAVVYLDAIIPEDGQSTMDLIDPARIAAFVKGAAGLGGDAVPPSTNQSIANANERAWVLAKMTPHPLGALVEGIRLTGAHTRVPKYIAVFAEGGAIGAGFADKCRAKPGWDVRFMQGGHSLMIDDAEGVAAILIEAAG
jgi:pimeloyl-ACP methyl ester carboxylesterase